MPAAAPAGYGISRAALCDLVAAKDDAALAKLGGAAGLAQALCSDLSSGLAGAGAPAGAGAGVHGHAQHPGHAPGSVERQQQVRRRKSTLHSMQGPSTPIA